MSKYFYIVNTYLEIVLANASFVSFQGSPGIRGSQGHPGDEGGPVRLRSYLFLFIYVMFCRCTFL